MKTLLVILAVLLASVCYAQDQVYTDSYPDYGTYYNDNGQKYVDSEPEYGSTIKQEGDRQQVYTDSVPEYGSYYKDGQRYENSYPVYGDTKED